MKKNRILKKVLILNLMFCLIGANILACIGAGKISESKVSIPIQNSAFNNHYSFFTNTCIEKSCIDPPSILWNKTFGGDGSDVGQKIRKTTDNGFIILGSSNSFDALGTDFWLLKTNSNGIEEWNYSYGSSLDEFGRDVQQTTDGGYIIVGYFFFFHSFDQGIRLVKTNSNGIEQWSKTFGSEYQPADGFSVYQTTDGGFLILGNNWSNNNSLYLIKTDANGNILWEKNVISPGYSYDSAKTDDGGFIITGAAFVGYNVDLSIMKIDTTLNKEWNVTLGGNMYDVGLSVIQTDDNHYVVAGCKDASEGLEGGDAWIIKFDSQGHKVWDRTIGSTDTDIGWSVAETYSGYVIVGTTGSYSTNNYDILIVRTDKLGNVDDIWNFGGDSYEEGYSVVLSSQGDYVITGYNSFGIYGSSDLWLLKIQGIHDSIPPDCQMIKPREGFFYIRSLELWPTICGITLIIGRITIQIDATDSDSGIKEVWVIIDGQKHGLAVWNPLNRYYEYTWDETALGKRFLSFEATDNAGNTKTCVGFPVWYFNIRF